MANSPLPSHGPTIGQNCYVSSAFSTVTKQGDKFKSGYLKAAFSGAHKWAELLHNPYVLTGPQTRGQIQKWLSHPCRLSGPQVGGIATQSLRARGSPDMRMKSEGATSILPSWWPTSGRICYVTHAFSEVLTQGNGFQSGYLNPAFSGAHMWAQLLWNPCALKGYPKKGKNSKVPSSTLPSRGPTTGRNCYVTTEFSGVHKQGDKIKSGYLNPASLGAHKWQNCYVISAFSGSPNKGTNSKVDTSPLPSRGPTSGQNCYVTSAFSGPPLKGTKSKVATSPLPSRGPTSG